MQQLPNLARHQVDLAEQQVLVLDLWLQFDLGLESG
jgi:hypothetical protein